MKRPLLGAGALLIVIVLSACSESSEPPPPPVPASYHRDVAPLVADKCGSCHVEGGIAPFSLQSYAEVFEMRTAVKAAVSQRMMPPWMPAKDCTEYLHDRSLSDEQIALISRWVDEGAVEGDPADAPTTTAPVQTGLSRVDLQLAMPVEYSPRKSPDDYRCFILDWPETAVRYVTGFRADPGRASIVHHVIAFIAKPEEVAGYQALDDAEAGPGYTCFGGPGGNSGSVGWLGSWAPGGQGSDYPRGTGIRVDPGSKIILQVHYNLSSAVSAADRTGVAVSVEPSVQKVAYMLPWADPLWLREGGMKIPAGQSDVRYRFGFDVAPWLSRVTNGTFRDNQAFTVHAAGLHMHTLGKWALAEIERKTGEHECMLRIPRWDFHWQNGYGLAQPKVVRPGDRLTVECHWDNSLPGAQDVSWGEGSNDEMCLGIFYLTQ